MKTPEPDTVALYKLIGAIVDADNHSETSTALVVHYQPASPRFAGTAFSAPLGTREKRFAKVEKATSKIYHLLQQ